MGSKCNNELKLSQLCLWSPCLPPPPALSFCYRMYLWIMQGRHFASCTGSGVQWQRKARVPFTYGHPALLRKPEAKTTIQSRHSSSIMGTLETWGWKRGCLVRPQAEAGLSIPSLDHPRQGFVYLEVCALLLKSDTCSWGKVAVFLVITYSR